MCHADAASREAAWCTGSQASADFWTDLDFFCKKAWPARRVVAAAMNEDKMLRAFNLFDKDGDGKISPEEYDRR